MVQTVVSIMVPIIVTYYMVFSLTPFPTPPSPPPLSSVKYQYVLVHDAVLEALTCGDTSIKGSDLRQKVELSSVEEAIMEAKTKSVLISNFR